MKLYEIAQQYERLLNMELDEETLADTLESIDADFDEKADNIACLIKSLEYEAKAIKEEVKKLSDRARAKENKAKYLKDYLYQTFKTLGKDKVETARSNLKIKLNPPSVLVDDDFYVSEYVEFIEEMRILKSKIKEDLNAGKTIKGARLEQGERLEVK